MDAGGRLAIRIRITHAWHPTGELGVRVTFSDKGHGIAADFLPRTTEAFTTTRSPTGAGLGLWVAEGVIAKHKGRLVIRSGTGLRHGTTVSVFLPYPGATDPPS